MTSKKTRDTSHILSSVICKNFVLYQMFEQLENMGSGACLKTLSQDGVGPF